MMSSATIITHACTKLFILYYTFIRTQIHKTHKYHADNNERP